MNGHFTQQENFEGYNFRAQGEGGEMRGGRRCRWENSAKQPRILYCEEPQNHEGTSLCSPWQMKIWSSFNRRTLQDIIGPSGFGPVRQYSLLPGMMAGMAHEGPLQYSSPMMLRGPTGILRSKTKANQNTSLIVMMTTTRFISGLHYVQPGILLTCHETVQKLQNCHLAWNID